MTELKQYLTLSKKDFLWVLIWIGFFWLLGEVMQLTLMFLLFREDQSYGAIGGLLGIAGLLVGMLTRSNLQSHTQFRLAISMGYTRRAYLVWNTLLVFLEGLAGLVVCCALIQLESTIFRALFPTWTNEMNIAAALRSITALGIGVGIVAAVAVFQIFLTAVMNRFGMRAFAVVWLVLWGGSMVVSKSIDAAKSGSTTLLSRLGAAVMRLGVAASPIFWGTLAAGIVLILGAVGVGMLSKAEIRF